MSRAMHETKDHLTPSEGLFRTLLTDSKLLYLTHALEQYEHAQLHLRQNEEQHRQVRQYLEYNRLRLFELDLAQQRMILVNSRAKVDLSGENESRAPDLPTGAPPTPTKPKAAVEKTLPIRRQRSNSINSISSINTASSNDLRPHAATEILLSLQQVVKSSVRPVTKQESIKVTMPPHQEPSQTNLPTIESANLSAQEQKAVTPNHSSPIRNWPEKGYTDNDVLCERGNFSYNHPGNKRYRAFVKSLQDRYVSGKKHDKFIITSQVLYYIQKECGGRFMGHDEDAGYGNWRELSNDEARRKVGQSLREKNKRYIPPNLRKRFVDDDNDGRTKEIHHATSCDTAIGIKALQKDGIM